MKSNGIFIFLPLLDSITMNLVMIFLFLIFVKFYNHELKVSSYLLPMLNSKTLNLSNFKNIWPLLDFGTLNSN
jgi:hypothetical protein